MRESIRKRSGKMMIFSEVRYEEEWYRSVRVGKSVEERGRV